MDFLLEKNQPKSFQYLLTNNSLPSITLPNMNVVWSTIDKIKKEYPSAKIVYADTDSYIIQLKESQKNI